MIYLSEETSSQENMEAWLSQLSDPEFPLLKDSVLKLLKPRLGACNFEEKSAEFAFTVEDWQLNPEKGLHGGIMATNFDVSFGLLSHYFAKQHMVSTVTIHTTFLKPVMPNDVIHYKVQMSHLGRTIHSMTAEAWLERDNILAATASASYMKLHQTFDSPI